MKAKHGVWVLGYDIAYKYVLIVKVLNDLKLCRASVKHWSRGSKVLRYES